MQGKSLKSGAHNHDVALRPRNVRMHAQVLLLKPTLHMM